jgi:hypothetical protein
VVHLAICLLPEKSEKQVTTASSSHPLHFRAQNHSHISFELDNRLSREQEIKAAGGTILSFFAYSSVFTD